MRTISLVSILFLCISIANAALDVTVSPYGQTPDGQEVKLYTMTNSSKMQIGVIEYGGYITSIKVPDKDGNFDDIVLGFDNLEGYLKNGLGGITGRFANRIANAKFTIDGTEYNVTKNAGPNHIHGGKNGFAKVVWKGTPFKNEKETGVRLTYLSKDGEEGYPGNLNVTVTYSLDEQNFFKIRYEAATDKPTVLNLTNHAYFNLAGAGNGDIRNHSLKILAKNHTAADKALIPTGQIESVKDTPLDFTEWKKLGADIDQLKETRGYDHNYIFDNNSSPVAVIVDHSTGRKMQLRTTQPAMMLYTANHFQNIKGRDAKTYNRHGAFCFETQHYPDSPNKPNFPSTVLRPSEKFDETTTFVFTITK